MTLTAERLREILDYDPKTGVFRWKARPSSYARRIRVGDVAGRINSNGYRQIGIDGQRYQAHRLAWLIVHGCWPAVQLDHADGNKINNRISNLREATHAQNQRNQRRRANNTSGHKGVSWSKQSRRWEAYIWLNRRRIHLGLFDTAEAAHAAYCAASQRLHGEFGRAA